MHSRNNGNEEESETIKQHRLRIPLIYNRSFKNKRKNDEEAYRPRTLRPKNAPNAVRTFATGHTHDVFEGLLHGEKRAQLEEANLPYDRANAPLTGFVLFNLRLTRGEKSGRDYRGPSARDACHRGNESISTDRRLRPPTKLVRALVDK